MPELHVERLVEPEVLADVVELGGGRERAANQDRRDRPAPAA